MARHMDRVRCADREEALFVQSTQDFGLGLETHVADLIEEEGSRRRACATFSVGPQGPPWR
jgi:hypothetical protein